MPDPVMQKMSELIETLGNRRYAAGYRKATQHIAIAVGQLDGESRVKLGALLDQLEAELHDAEAAAK